MVDHQIRDLDAIQQDDLDVDVRNIVPRIGREPARRHEDALAGTLTMKRTHELLDFGTTHRSLPSLGLDVDDIQAKTIFLYDPVYSAIAGSSIT